MILDFVECKKPDFLYSVNIKVMQKLYRVLNHENNRVKPEPGNFFRFYVGQGNNHNAVKHVVKRRSWWLREKHERFLT
jgi:tubulin---tyrosine ligase